MREEAPDRWPMEKAEEWRRRVTNAYFPLTIDITEPAEFSGDLSQAALGELSLSRLRSAPVSYRREPRHIVATSDEEYLITVPIVSPVEFSQLGHTVRCLPGAFLLERGHEPYLFQYDAPNDLLVMKVGARALAERIGPPDRVAQHEFDASGGVGRLFATMLGQALADAATTDDVVRTVIGRQLLELLGLTIANDPRAASSSISAVRAAHLRRAEGFIRTNLANPDLSPGLLAAACGISTRYLHALYREMNTTVARQIREARLVAARDALCVPGMTAISEIAYRFGFSDQAQFSRLFKQAFDLTPSTYRQHNGTSKPGPGTG
ncbi:helix-turn-helix domain-containing protein [Amaricoccus sp. W119]